MPKTSNHSPSPAPKKSPTKGLKKVPSSSDRTTTTPQEQDAKASFLRHKARIEELPDALVSSPSLSVMDAVWLGLELDRQAQQDRERLEKLADIGEISKASLDDLRTLALSLWHVESCWQHAKSNKRSKSETIKSSDAEELRKELLAAADYLWRRDSRVKKMLKEIREGSGMRDLADDLQRLAQLFRERWEEVEGRTDIERDDIERAGRLSVQILDKLLEEDERTFLKLRNQAFSLFAQAYQEVQAAGRFLYHKNKSLASQLYPSLSSSKSTKKATTPSTEPTPSPVPDPA